MKTLVLGALVMGLVVAGDATAQRYDGGYSNYGRSGYEDGRYEYARVVRVDPIIVADSYNERTSERCYDRPSNGYYTSNDGYYRDGGYSQSDVSNRGVASVIGGIAGAVLGSRVGGGNGRLVGTAVGTMAGVAAGRSIYEANNRTYQATSGSVSRCPIAANATAWMATTSPTNTLAACITRIATTTRATVSVCASTYALTNQCLTHVVSLATCGIGSNKNAAGNRGVLVFWRNGCGVQ